MDLNYIISKADELFDEAVETRRHFHMYPEVGNKEFVTQKYIADFLEKQGIEYKKIAGTGLVATVTGKNPGRVIALRSDMDALPMHEGGSCAYRSKNDGVMHACGHDGHTAINMYAAKFFSDNRQSFDGTIKFFFQPAEENIGGAVRMIKEGCMENPKVEHVLGIHLMPYIPYNQVEVKDGPLNAAVDTARITFKGKGGHGAYPDTTVDTIVMAGQFITAAQTIVSRNVSPLNSAVFTIGKISGGDVQNIITDTVKLDCTIRSSNPKVRELMFKRVREVAQGIAAAMGGKAEVDIEEGYIALLSDKNVMDVVREAATEYLGSENVIEKEFMSMGGEDFSFFCEVVPSAFYSVGCRVDGRDEYSLHARDFDLDERCLKTGMVVEIYTALKLLSMPASK